MMRRLFLQYAPPGTVMDLKQQRKYAWLGLLGLLETYDRTYLRDALFKKGAMDPAADIREMVFRHCDIRTEKGGKPVLTGESGLWFNVSHCRYCAAAVISDHPVGIDVERRFPFRQALASRFMSPDELAQLDLILEEKEKLAFYNRIWSRKESYLKCTGRGLMIDPRKVSVLEMNGFTEYQNDLITLCVHNAT